MNKVLLEGAIFFAKHGVFEEEAIVGGKFEVNVEIETDFTESAENDVLEGTIDYSRVYSIVKEEMDIPSKLIEHVGQRMVSRIYQEFERIQKVKLKISKLTPPITGDIQKVSIVIEQ